MLAYAFLATAALVALACATKNLSVPTLVAGVVLIAYFMGGALDGVTFKLGSQNATMDLNVDAAEFAKVKSMVAELNTNLFGDASQGSGQRLSSLASLLRDTDAVEGKILEVKSVLQTFTNNSEAVEAFLDSQAQRMDGLVRSAVDHALELTTEERFWERLQPRLAASGLLRDLPPDVLVRIEVEKARVQEELRISGGVAAEVERVRAEGWVRLALAVSRDFNEHLPLRAAVFLGVCAAFFALRLVYHVVLRRLQVPPLIDETSRTWRPGWCPRRGRPRLGAAGSGGDVAAAVFKAGSPEIVLAPDVQESVCDMARVALWTASADRRARGGKQLALPNAVFYGPPGTGKSLTARRLASACGLDYALMSGGNVLGLREEAVPELRRIFDWARRAPRGLVLFIDEAEAFLAARGAGGSPFVQAAVSFFLAQTTMSSPRLWVILATNRVQDLDEAVLSRLPFQIEFGRPDASMVARLVDDRMYVLSPEARACLRTTLEVSGVRLHELGFAGRDVQSLFEEFDRRWTLQRARDEPAQAKDGDRSSSPGRATADRKAELEWLRRWLRHRSGVGSAVAG